MYEACGAYWRALHPRPDVAAWTLVLDPVERMALALAQVHKFYDETEGMTANVLRDEQVLPGLANVARFHDWMETATDRLCEAWPGEQRSSLRPIVRLAIDFHTWHLLVRRLGLAPAAASELLLRFVR